jgi:hypothetical protein
MALTDLPIKPGFYSDDTDRDVGKLGFWVDGDKVRFFAGLPAKLGGWTRGAQDDAYLGSARGATDLRTLRQEVVLSFGTHLKLYVWLGGTYYDITPIDTSGTLANPFTTTINLATVSVTHASHGRTAGDYVTFSGAAAVGGITISGEYTVTSVTSANAYGITHTAVATSSAGPGGGAAVGYSYQLPVGSTSAVQGLGWGASTWGASTWGTARSASDIIIGVRTWQLDLWGEDVIASPVDGAIYVWDSSAGVTVRATRITQAPVTAKGIFVSPEDRHLVAIGAHDGVADDPMLVRWCDQEDYTNWTPSLTNTAGSKRLDTGNALLCALKVRGENLIFSDSALYSMVFVGPPDTFAFRQLGDNGNLVGPMAGHVFEGVAYWMADKDFFIYDGLAKTLECSVSTTVFDDFNRDQGAKVYCGVNRDYREVWWLYPSGSSDENDRYVIYNLNDKTWAFGTLARTMLIGDSDVFNYAYGFGADSYLYTHESGTDAYNQPMTAYIESGAIEIDAGGNALAHISKMIPDFKTLVGSVDVTFTGKKYPQATETQVSGPHTISPTTEFVNPRMRCRQISVRLESSDLGDDWRSGVLRVDLVPHGGR